MKEPNVSLKDCLNKDAEKNDLKEFYYPSLHPSIKTHIITIKTNTFMMLLMLLDLMIFKNIDIITLIGPLEVADKVLFLSEALSFFFESLHVSTAFTTTNRI